MDFAEPPEIELLREAVRVFMAAYSSQA